MVANGKGSGHVPSAAAAHPPEVPLTASGGRRGMSGSSSVAAVSTSAFEVFGVGTDTSNVVTALRV